MDIEYHKHGSKWIVEVWSDDALEPIFESGFKEPYAEGRYEEINQWCIDTLGYHARTAYHVFELRKQSHLNWFIMRWK